MKHIAIIPARSGSKGLKDKNIKELNGKPLMAYTIEAAIKSRLFDTVFVSTDSAHYAEIARNYGAEVPELRGLQNSQDKASSWDVVKESLELYQDRSGDFDMFTLLQPTSPLRNEIDIQMSYKEFIDKNANAIVGVCEVDHSPLWCNILPDDKSLIGFIKTPGISRQELATYYRINGSIYMVDTLYFLKYKNIYKERVFAYIMDKKNSIDIDDSLDFNIAQMLQKDMRGGGYLLFGILTLLSEIKPISTSDVRRCA